MVDDDLTAPEEDPWGFDEIFPPSKVFSVRLPTDELDKLTKVAAWKGVPPSALVRTWTLTRLDAEHEEMLGHCPRCGQTTPPSTVAFEAAYLDRLKGDIAILMSQLKSDGVEPSTRKHYSDIVRQLQRVAHYGRRKF